MRIHRKNFRIILSAMFLALAYVMPFLTGQIPEIGTRLCPMHIPVLLCGFICGWPLGLAVGFIAPLLRSATLGLPLMFPNALCMAFELGAYGAVSGLMHRILPHGKPFVYCSLLISMLAGKIIWGIAMFFCLGLSGGTFGIQAFIAGAFTNALPGIIIQLVIIPIIIINVPCQGKSASPPSVKTHEAK